MPAAPLRDAALALCLCTHPSPTREQMHHSQGDLEGRVYLGADGSGGFTTTAVAECHKYLVWWQALGRCPTIHGSAGDIGLNRRTLAR